jgi:hypothetical protein
MVILGDNLVKINQKGIFGTFLDINFSG